MIRHLGTISYAYTPSDHQIYKLIISLHLKLIALTSMGIKCTISLNCDYYWDALIILPKTILIRHLGTISYPYTPSDHQIYLLIISLHLKIHCVNVYGHLVYHITKIAIITGLRWLYCQKRSWFGIWAPFPTHIHLQIIKFINWSFHCI